MYSAHGLAFRFCVPALCAVLALGGVLGCKRNQEVTVILPASHRFGFNTQNYSSR